MVYRLHFITAAGTSDINANPFDSIESAMTAARPALCYGAIDAWVVDDEGKKCADFEAIKKHCGSSQNSN